MKISGLRLTWAFEAFVSDQFEPVSVTDRIFELTRNTDGATPREQQSGYDAGRTLIVQPNRQSQGLVKVSDFRNHIGESSPFDAVFLLHGIALSQKKGRIGFHVHQLFPRPATTGGLGMAEVEVEVKSGQMTVPFSKISSGEIDARS